MSAIISYSENRDNLFSRPMLTASTENTTDYKGVSSLAFRDPRVIWESTGTGLQYVLIDYGVARKVDAVYIGNIPIGTTALTLKAGTTSATTDASKAITIYGNDGFQILRTGIEVAWNYRYYRVEITNGGTSHIGNISLFQNVSSLELFDGNPDTKTTFCLGLTPRVEVKKYGPTATNQQTGQLYERVGGVRNIETNQITKMPDYQKNLLPIISLSDEIVFVRDVGSIFPDYGSISFSYTQEPSNDLWRANYIFASLVVSDIEGKL